ncbi:AAA family ATPase [Maribellus maritimus]|uniref:AAA family ATPase n=1 Tax=Maribellus maritimus TaxID=2870838 RepID=UPI001EEB65CE|nr:AAA family ATPase [Maribellus maritimus]MCG6191365.1 hypothetical protein [Maribellus maritimus]
MNRLTLKNLVYKGTGKKPAIIEFSSGFNVITGPSDTGKSLIFECLSYVLGSSTVPKEPTEAKGYTNLFLTIEHDGNEFTIERSTLSNDVNVYEMPYDDIDDNSDKTTLSGSANAKDNISDFLLNKINISSKKLKKNERNETVNLTFNILRKLLLVDEGKIQSTYSPIFSGMPTSVTVEKSLFKFLITGIDYSQIIVKQKPEIRKADATARINLLEHLLNKGAFKFDSNISKEELEAKKAKIENEINVEIINISENQKEIDELQTKRKQSWEEALSIESKLIHVSELLSRFQLLSEQYQNDLNRLDAIIETGEILNQSKDELCPVCGAKSEYHQPDCIISNEEINNVKDACFIEKQKINSLQSDLQATIKQVDAQKQNYTIIKTNEEESYKWIDKQLNEKLEPSVNKIKGRLSKLYEAKKDIEITLGMIEQLEEMKELREKAVQDLKPQKKTEKVQTGVQAAEINDLLKLIEAQLTAWGYPDIDRIGFSEDLQDITIGAKNRKDQGKGYRAITHAAFIISLMNYCSLFKKPHAGFVVLDSPLVTFKKADKKAVGSDAISDDMKKLFYRNLSTIGQDKQIIVLENDNPPSDVTRNINYIHFTKNEKNGRYGFIPLTNED